MRLHRRSSFAKRHKEYLNFAPSKSTSKSRVDPITLENTTFFIQVMEELSYTQGIKIRDDGANLFNTDETLLTVSSKNEGKLVRMTDSLRKAHRTKSSRLNTVGSVLPFAGANGDVPFIAVILKAEEGKKTAFRMIIESQLKKKFRRSVQLIDLP